MTSVYIYQRDLTGSLQTKTTGSGVWNYGYDLTDQLTSEQFSNQQSSIYNQQFSYDPMGNRLFSHEGAQGTQKETVYEPNSLNQYEVTVSTNLTTSTVSTNVLSYDSNGNLTNDSIRAYTWDLRNQLVKVEPLSPTNGALKAEFTYDYMGRRISKKVSSWQSSGSLWSEVRRLSYFYDGWNLVRELIAQNSSVITNSYVWGNDLSQTLQGAGGVGGLLAVIHQGGAGSPSTPYYPLYDHNGNIEKYLTGSGAVVASFQYDVFGNTISETILTNSTGLTSSTFTFRFSTKYFDAETGLAYYG